MPLGRRVATLSRTRGVQYEGFWAPDHVRELSGKVKIRPRINSSACTEELRRWRPPITGATESAVKAGPRSGPRKRASAGTRAPGAIDRRVGGEDAPEGRLEALVAMFRKAATSPPRGTEKRKTRRRAVAPLRVLSIALGR